MGGLVMVRDVTPRGGFLLSATSNSFFSTGSIVRCMMSHVEDSNERSELQNLLSEAAFFFTEAATSERST
jgi:hypothetical protein